MEEPGSFSGKLVGRGDKRQAGQVRQLLRHRHSIALRRVQASAHGRAAQRQFAQVRQGRTHMLLGMVQLRHPARNLLTQRDRRGVLQVGAANFYDIGKRLGFVSQRGAQGLERGQKLAHQRIHRRHMHGGGENVVA